MRSSPTAARLRTSASFESLRMGLYSPPRYAMKTRSEPGVRVPFRTCCVPYQSTSTEPIATSTSTSGSSWAASVRARMPAHTRCSFSRSKRACS